MARNTSNLIAELVGDLQPVKPLKIAHGLVISTAALGASLAIVAMLMGIRPDVVRGHFDEVFLLSNGLFLMLGIAAAVTVIVMGRPRVGTDHSGWVWAAAMAGLLPLTAFVMGISDSARALAQSQPDHGMACVLAGSALALITGAALTLWLRRGAPTSPERAGLLTGLAAGSFGIFAFAFHCPINDIYHIGLWHGAVVVVCAAVGRMIVPGLVRW